MPMMQSRVISAMPGCSATSCAAIGARVKPISMTTAPVTTGGIRESSSRAPNAFTAMPTATNNRPATSTPPRSNAGLAPSSCAALSGATNAKDEPR